METYRLNLNRQDSDSGLNYEVHRKGCIFWPTNNVLDLGNFYGCLSAISEAKRLRPSLSSYIDGCATCSSECHNA